MKFIAVPAAVWLVRRVDTRIVALLGLMSFAIAACMGTRITHEWSPDDFIPMALVQSVGQGLTVTGLLIFVLSNSNPARATAFVAYIQVMRLDVIEIAKTAMTTWLRVREQVHSHLVGLHVSVGDSDMAKTLGGLTGPIAERSATRGDSTAGGASGPADTGTGKMVKLPSPCRSPSGSRSMTKRNPRNWHRRTTSTSIALAGC
jgi:DHA2 family multidrug resistance protein